MPQPTRKRADVPAARKPAGKSTAAGHGKNTAAKETKSAVDRTAELSEDVLRSVENGQRAAIAAVRLFVDTVDEMIPAIGARPSHRERLINAALEMADKLVTTQYEILRSVVRGVDHSLTGPAAKK